MITQVLCELYERDLNKLRDEMEAYANEADIWKTSGEITNSAGNLCLHLTGNLQHFFGAILGDTGYVRDRDAEFANRSVARNKLLSEIDAAVDAVKKTLENLSSEDLAKNYPIEVFGHPMTTEYFVTHLAAHFNYHLGQINYHRRMLS